jgi:hypothetical protein
MAAITGRPDFDYKNFLKRRVFFVAHVLPYLAAGRAQAIHRAEVLEAAFTAVQPYHQCNPCTKVHHLVNSILSFA